MKFAYEVLFVLLKTLYTLTANVEPLGSEFCRIGSICHMNITIGRAHKSEYSSLMYEVLADQLMWAVCGRTAGTFINTCQHNFSLSHETTTSNIAFKQELQSWVQMTSTMSLWTSCP